MNISYSLKRSAALAVAALSCLTGPMAVAQDAAGEPAGAWATPEQVERGGESYEQICSSCHGNDIVSLFATFPSAGMFYGFISTTMPANAPGSLPAQQYADIIAFLGAENGMSVGTEELPPDQAILDTIRPSDFEGAE